MSPHASDSTKRFSDRVEDYIRYRPGYPEAVIETLVAEAGLQPNSRVADIGSGTGISTELFLRHGCEVYGVEPNQAMREAAELQLANYEHFHSVTGTAENSSLSSENVDLVVAGQAFHWFDHLATRDEFSRILKPEGSIALFWNSRRLEGSDFLVAYEELLNTYGTDYQAVSQKNVTDKQLQEFFGRPFQTHVFSNEQTFDFSGLRGRLLSSSYSPAEGHPNHLPMLSQLRSIFDTHQTNGQICFLYDFELFIC